MCKQCRLNSRSSGACGRLTIAVGRVVHNQTVDVVGCIQRVRFNQRVWAGSGRMPEGKSKSLNPLFGLLYM